MDLIEIMMKLVWLVIPLVLIGIIGVQESFAEEVGENRTYTLEEALEIQRNRTGSSITNNSSSVENTYPRELTAEEEDERKSEMLKKLFAETTLSPLKQLKNYGLFPSDVSCFNEKILIFKKSDSSPTCVTPETAEKLITRDWGKSTLANYPIEMTIPSNNYCNVSSDCVFHYSSCRAEVCWNKDNLPEPIASEPNMGMCLPPSDVSECTCEKNRCQPIPDDKTSGNIYYPPCKSGMNCFADEICLDYNMKSWDGVALKRYDSDSKQCHLQCNSDSDCPAGYCINAKLVSDEIYDEMSGVRPSWDNHPLIVDAPEIKFCWSYQP